MSIDKTRFEVRRPMVAGMFYPSDPIELSKMIADFFVNAKRIPFDDHIRAIIAPHAGYKYSGQIAAQVYKQIEGLEYDTVVVLAPFHQGFFKGVSVFSGGGYQTPIGVVEIDLKLSDRISQIHPTVFLSTTGHTGTGGRGEHSLEVQLPFLQIILGKFKLVAMVMGDQEESTIRSTAEVLSTALKNRNTLLVASSDLSHFHSEKEARVLDGNFEKALASFNSNRIIDIVSQGGAEACGFGPVAAVVEACRRRGGKQVRIVNYDTSGSITGDFSEVVGYLSAAITGTMVVSEKPAVSDETRGQRDDEYTVEEQSYLLNLARRVVESRITDRKFEKPPVPDQRMNEKRGVFVTIKKKGMLRGCIGLIQAKQSLATAVEEMAAAAAFDDPRFPPVSESELAELEYEISVLSPLSLVENVNDIEVNRDGLMIRLDLHSGLLLPQVATENGWDRKAFLEQTCLKAGLPKNSYKDKQAKIYKFSVFKF